MGGKVYFQHMECRVAVSLGRPVVRLAEQVASGVGPEHRGISKELAEKPAIDGNWSQRLFFKSCFDIFLHWCQVLSARCLPCAVWILLSRSCCFLFLCTRVDSSHAFVESLLFRMFNCSHESSWWHWWFWPQHGLTNDKSLAFRCKQTAKPWQRDRARPILVWRF